MYIDGDKVFSVCSISDCSLLIPLEQTMLVTHDWKVVRQVKVPNMAVGRHNFLPGFHIETLLLDDTMVGKKTWGELKSKAMKTNYKSMPWFKKLNLKQED